jgi:hypothetical protein
MSPLYEQLFKDGDFGRLDKGKEGKITEAK